MLYTAYAAELSGSLGGILSSIHFPNKGEQPAPPALIVGGTVLQPSDDMTVSPNDLIRMVVSLEPP